MKWKTSFGEKCPHGLRVMIVNGSYVRNNFESDYTQGGNGFAYKFIPKNEIWIDKFVPKSEWPLIAFHECQEAELMRGGMSYDRAHDTVKAIEDIMRRKQHPGERR